MTDKDDSTKTEKENIIVARAWKMAQEKNKEITQEEVEARFNERFLNGAFGPTPQITSEEQDKIVAIIDDWP